MFSGTRYIARFRTTALATAAFFSLGSSISTSSQLPFRATDYTQTGYHEQGMPVPMAWLNTRDSEHSPQWRGMTFYFGRNGDIMQVNLDRGSDVRSVGNLLGPSFAMTSPNISADECQLLLTAWPHGTNPSETGRIYLARRSDRDAHFGKASPVTVQYGDERLDKRKRFEGEAAFFKDGECFVFSRSVDDPEITGEPRAPDTSDFDLQSRGLYEATFSDPLHLTARVVRKWTEFDAMGEGRVGNIFVLDNNHEAIYSCYNCRGGMGNWDLAYADRDSANEKWRVFDVQGNVRFLPKVNTIAAEFGCSADAMGHVLFGSQRTGNRDLFLISLPLNSNGKLNLESKEGETLEERIRK